MTVLARSYGKNYAAGLSPKLAPPLPTSGRGGGIHKGYQRSCHNRTPYDRANAVENTLAVTKQQLRRQSVSAEGEIGNPLDVLKVLKWWGSQERDYC